MQAYAHMHPLLNCSGIFGKVRQTVFPSGMLPDWREIANALIYGVSAHLKGAFADCGPITGNGDIDRILPRIGQFDIRRQSTQSQLADSKCRTETKQLH
jgi:hypothetical protein